MIISLHAVFYATNRAFAMLDLSTQHAAAVQRHKGEFEAADALLAVGQSHVPENFLGFALVRLLYTHFCCHVKGGIFSKLNAWVGIFGFGMLGIYEICQSFIPGSSSFVLIFAMIGGILNLVWYGLITHRFFKMA
jgi:hypothetical protein